MGQKSKVVEGDGSTRVEKIVTDAWVEVGLEYTKNLGNFENIRLRIAAGRPVKDGETPGEAVDKVYNFVGGKLSQKSAEIASDLGE